MDAATLILTMTFAGQTFDKVMTRPTLVECEEYARDVVQSAPKGWTVSYRCGPHLKADTNLPSPNQSRAR